MKLKIQSENRTQQQNVITKCRNWGAAARDGDYGPVAGKDAVVINTSLGGSTPALLLSRNDFSPSKKAYTKIMTYKEFMNATVCPWDRSASPKDSVGGSSASMHTTPRAEIREIPVPVFIPVEVGVCAQDTLKVTACEVLVQEAIGFNTIGLPFLIDNGVEVTMSEGVAYIIDIKNNTAKPLTAKSAAKRAKKAILAGKNNVWTSYAKRFDLVTDCTLTKDVDSVDGDDD